MGMRKFTARLFHRGRREEGQATFEFLLTVPFVIVFFLLLVDLGIMMYSYVSVANSVREGARYASVNCSTGSCVVSDIKDRVIDRSGGLLNSGDAGEVTVTWTDIDGDGNSAGRGDAVTVKVSHTFNFLFFPTSTEIVSCSDMRLEKQDNGSSLPTGSGCD